MRVALCYDLLRFSPCSGDLCEAKICWTFQSYLLSTLPFLLPPPSTNTNTNTNTNNKNKQNPHSTVFETLPFKSFGSFSTTLRWKGKRHVFRKISDIRRQRNKAAHSCSIPPLQRTVGVRDGRGWAFFMPMCFSPGLLKWKLKPCIS